VQPKARAGLLIAVLGISAACSDSTGTELTVALRTDTVEVAAPLPQNEGLPTAVDITPSAGLGVIGGRFPERSRDAQEWDFAVRVRNGELVLVPARAVGLTNTRAAISRALEGETFEGLREAPGQSAFNPDSSVAVRPGNVYAVRSRPAPCQFGAAGEFYGKIEPLTVDVANGRLRFRIVTNLRCEDPRLVQE
jgi:hypothetical protein